MPYPWPSFGSFTWLIPETALADSDTGWLGPQVQLQQAVPLGGNRDIAVVMGLGSQTRSFECLLEDARYEQLKNLVGTTSRLCDWRRPVPSNKTCLLLSCEHVGLHFVVCRDATGSTIRRRVRVKFLEQ
jgi:hypothetical protein